MRSCRLSFLFFLLEEALLFIECVFKIVLSNFEILKKVKIIIMISLIAGFARMFAVLPGIMRVRKEAAENDFILQNLKTNFFLFLSFIFYTVKCVCFF